MKQILLVGMATALLVSTPVWGPAQEAASPSPAALKPVVTVALSSYDQIVTSLGSINPQIPLFAEAGLNSLTGGQGLQGLDRKRPLGLVVRTDDQQFPAQLILPVTDLAKLLKSLEPTLGPAEEKEGVYELESGDRSVFVKKVGDWAFVAMGPEGLENLPEKPLEALGGLQEQYDLGIRLTIKNIPMVFRQMGLGLIQTFGQQGLAKLPEESDEQHALRIQAYEQGMQRLTQWVNELDTVVLGLKLDSKGAKAALETTVTAVEGSELAKQLAVGTEATETHFGGFLAKGAALTYIGTQKLPAANINHIVTSLDASRVAALKALEEQDLREDELAMAKEALGQLLDVVKATVQSGKVDVGGAVRVAPDALTIVAGGRVLETAKVDAILQKFLKKAMADEPKLAEMVKLNAEEYQGIRFHRALIPLNSLEMEEESAAVLEKLVGKEMEIYVGIGPESVYGAVGRDALATLKKAIDQSKMATKVPPMQMQLAATPLVKCIGAVAEDAKAKNVATVLTQALEATPGQDHVNVTMVAVPQGAKFRIEMEAGILKILGLLPTLGAAL